MKKFLLASALVLVVIPAFAANNQAVSTSRSTATAAAAASARSAATSNAQGGSAQSNAQGGGATINSRVAVAPGLSGLTGTSCMGSTSISGAGLTFGLGVGTTWEDKECTLRENIKIVAHFDENVAQAMMMNLTGVREAFNQVYPGLVLDEPEGAKQRPSWCEGRNLATASDYDKRMCQ